MASDHPGETSVSLTLPESLSTWLDDVAREEDVSREDVLLQLLSAYRQLDGDNDGEVEMPDGVESIDRPATELMAELREDVEEMVDGRMREHEAEMGEGFDRQIADRMADVLDERPEGALAERLDERLGEVVDERLEEVVDERLEEVVDERLAGEGAESPIERSELDDGLDEVRSEFEGLIEDVRNRVFQVKREADTKAASDHDHPGVVETVEELDDALSTLRTDVETVERQLDAGFENFEDVLGYLTDSVDELSARQTTLARALVETRDELRTLAARDAGHAAADALRRSANRHGISNASCEECETPVDLGLLSRAECPHCSSTFGAVEPASGFFGTSTLTTGDRPALEGGHTDGASGFEFSVEEIIEAESPAAGAAETGDHDE
jgi:hypothetical protein